MKLVIAPRNTPLVIATDNGDMIMVEISKDARLPEGLLLPVSWAYFLVYADRTRTHENPIQLTEWRATLDDLYAACRNNVIPLDGDPLPEAVLESLRSTQGLTVVE